MEPNNFEKQVQQKLDELKIPPSDSLWANIEKRIPQKRRRKKAVFILIFLALFLLTGGYWLLNSRKNMNAIPGNQVSHLIKNNTEIVRAEKQPPSLIQPATSDKTDTARDEKNIPKVSFSLKKKPILPINKKDSIIIKETHLKPKIQNEISSENKTDRNADAEDLPNLKGKQNNLLEEEIDLAKHDAKANAEVEEVSLEKIYPDSIKNITASIKMNDGIDSIFSGKNSGISVNKNQKRKWILGVTFSGGKSFLANKLLGINNNNGNYQSMPNTGTGGGSSSPSPLPAETRNSVAFIGGAFLEKNISKKIEISLGINYKYFSAVNKTGSRIDSALTAYNSTSYTNSYRNNFNYLELPVLLKFQLTNNRSLPFYWVAGINVSQLISSNALQLKGSPGVYYNDNSLFNKTQLGFSTAFSATLFSKQKNPINIGPYFYYNASRLAHEGLYQKKHFSSIGIFTEILFHKK